MTPEELKLKITERLRTISAVTLQRLAQDIAVRRDPHRYRNLQVQGENAESQSVAGWPDAYVAYADGSVDGVEATREKDGNWRKHLWDDLAKCSDDAYPSLNGYLFVAGYPKGRIRPHELSTFQEQFTKCGVPEDRLEILIGEGLVYELLKPQYAQSVSRHLGIRRRPSGFEVITDAPPPSSLKLFEPSPEEYREGKIYRPRIAASIEHALRERGFACVFGRGAAGKTVLAKAIANQQDYLSSSSYYCSLRGHSAEGASMSSSIEESIGEFAGPGILFIVDDIHVNETQAVSIYESWNEGPRHDGARLLLVGRETRRIGQSAWSASEVPPFVLRAQQEEVLGVYRRLMSRHCPIVEVPEPPPGAVRQWVKTFGGSGATPQHSVDLMALGAAIQYRRESLREQNWSLTVDDARREIRETYLAPLDKGERRNLLRLAALPEECPLQIEALVDPYASFQKSIQDGLVFETERGKTSKSVQYSLVHSALGNLLLAGAAGDEVEREAECIEASCTSVYQGLQIAHLSALQGNDKLAKEVLDNISSDPRWFLHVPSHMSLTQYLELGDRLGVDLIAIGKSLDTASRQGLLTWCMTSAIHTFMPLLSYLDKCSSRFALVRDDLVADLIGNRVALADRVINADPTHLGFLIRKALQGEGSLPQLASEVFNILIEQKEHVARRVCNANAAQITVLLVLAQSYPTYLLPLYLAMTHEMKDSNGGFVEKARSWSLQSTLGLLHYIIKKNEFKSLYQALANDWLKRREDVLAELKLSDMGTLLSFFRLCDVPNSMLQSLKHSMLQYFERNPGEAASKMCVRPLFELASFLICLRRQRKPNNSSGKTLVKLLWDSVSLKEWDEQRSAAVQHELPIFISVMLEQLPDLKRPELFCAPARNALARTPSRFWRAPGIGSRQLADNLRFYDGDAANLADFIDRVINPPWLEIRYREDDPNDISDCLWSVAAVLDSAHHVTFLSSTLSERVAHMQEWTSDEDGSTWHDIFRLGGIAALIGANVRWDEPVAESALAGIVRRSIRDGNGVLEDDQIEFWSGLFEFARTRMAPFEVRSNVGEDIYDRWPRSPCSSVFLSAFRATILNWLSEGRNCGWRLPPPELPLRSYVLHHATSVNPASERPLRINEEE